MEEQIRHFLQSITKALATACLFLKFNEKKVFSLDDFIDAFLPAEAPQDLKGRGITFRHLLCHASGLSDGDLGGGLAGDFAHAQALWEHMFSAPSHFAPGSAIEYSDLGYRVLGKILEVHQGQNLERLCRE